MNIGFWVGKGFSFIPPKSLSDYEEQSPVSTCDVHAVWARNKLWILAKTNKQKVTSAIMVIHENQNNEIWWFFFTQRLGNHWMFLRRNPIYSIKPCSLNINSVAVYSKDSLLSQLILILDFITHLKLLIRNNNKNPNQMMITRILLITNSG